MKPFNTFLLFLILYSCNNDTTDNNISPFSNSQEFLKEIQTSNNYSIKTYLKIAVSTNLNDFILKDSNKVSNRMFTADISNKKIIMVLSDSLLQHINENDLRYLKSLLNSTQKCSSSMLYSSSFANSNYSTIGIEALFILLNLKYKNHFRCSIDIISKKDSLIKLVL